jgi:molecular chaperone DnaK
MPVFGFDFGTTNSLVSFIRGNRPINLLGDDGLPIPSVACYEGNRTIVGRGAKERLAEAGLGIQGNIVRSPKMLLGRDSVFIEGVERSPVDIVADVAGFVRRQATTSAQIGLGLTVDLKQVVATIPISMEGRRRRALRDAFRKAGMTIVQFVHEPLAALYGFFRSSQDYGAMLRRYDRKLILVFDWGGGTLDLTLCRLVDGVLTQIANDGTDEIGGDVFDETVKNEIVKRVVRSRGWDEAVNILPNATARLLHRCERAKIDLSTRDVVELYVANFFRGVENEELDYSLTRETLEEITLPLVEQGLARVRRLLEAAAVPPQQVALCLAVGGMVSMPSIKARLHEWFGPERVHVPSAAGTLVAEGAAWVAHDQARLLMAKHVELLLARNSYMQLIPARTEMPREGEVQSREFDLYCVDPTDGTAKFQIQSPVRPGANVLPNDRRTPLDSLVIPVDSRAKPFRERLRLTVQVDDNLILHAAARSLDKGGLAETEIHSLEFGLSLPEAQEQDLTAGETEPTYQDDTKPEPGSLTMRANVADREDNYLVPGEVLYRFDPVYFRDHSAPEIQERERLYYVPCARCGRASSDPLCRCDSTPSVSA